MEGLIGGGVVGTSLAAMFGSGLDMARTFFVALEQQNNVMNAYFRGATQDFGLK